MPRGRPKKDPFANLDPEFKNAVEGMNTEQAKMKIAEIAMAEAENRKNEKEDIQLKEAKQAASDAGAQYKEATKAHVAQIGYIKSILEARGKV